MDFPPEIWLEIIQILSIESIEKLRHLNLTFYSLINYEKSLKFPLLLYRNGKLNNGINKIVLWATREKNLELLE
jgi:hypothetical protein